MGDDPGPKIIRIYCQTDSAFHEEIIANIPFDASIRWHCKGACRKWKTTLIERGDVKGTYDAQNQGCSIP